MIELQHIEKRHPGSHTPILSDLSARFFSGQVTVIVGASGAGKTTLLHHILRLEKPDKGMIHLGTDSITGVLQSPALFQHKTVLENLTLALEQVKKYSKAESIDKAYAMLDRFELREKALAYPGELSGGEKQRVGIARALVLNPDILVLDEPTNALNQEWVDALAHILQDHAEKGMTIILSTHHGEFAQKVADDLYLLEEGQLKSLGSPSRKGRGFNNINTMRR